MATITPFKLTKEDLAYTIDNCISYFALFAKTAKKNLSIAKLFQDSYLVSFVTFVDQIKNSSYFDDLESSRIMVQSILTLKDISLIVFQGSVISSAIGNSQELLLLHDLLDFIYKQYPNAITKKQIQIDKEAVLILIKERFEIQKSSQALKLIFKDFPKSLGQDAVLKTLLTDYDSDEAYMLWDLRRYFYNDFCDIKEAFNHFYEVESCFLEIQNLNLLNSDPNFNHLGHEIFNQEILALSTNVKYASPKVANFYRCFWLSSFGNKTKVPMDEFVFNLAVYGQIFYGSQGNQQVVSEFSKEQLLNRLVNQNFEVDLNKIEGAEIVKLSVNAVLCRSKDPDLNSSIPSLPTIYPNAQAQIDDIKTESFILIDILELCQQLKLRNGSQIELSICNKKFEQNFISFGSYPYNDIILAKTWPIGINTCVLITDNTIKLTDYSNLNIPEVRSAIESEAEKLNNLNQDDFINLGGVPTYKVTSTNPLTLLHAFDLNIVEKDAAIYKPKLEIAYKGTDVSIGRLKKNDACVNSCAVSGKHAILQANGIKDNGSTNGTYLYLINGIKDRTTQPATVEIASKCVRFVVGNKLITLETEE